MPDPLNNQNNTGSNRHHHDVFISYAQYDKPIADAICAKLELRKIRCWIAPRDVPPAKDFPEAIIEAIEGSQVVVLVFSSHANSSPHVTRELTNAVNRGRIIVPFRVEDVTPSKTMEYLIGVPHWLDAITPPLEKYMDQLADTVEHLLVKKKEFSCRVCNTPLPPNAKFCNACGVAVAPDVGDVTTPAGEKGTEVPAGPGTPVTGEPPGLPVSADSSEPQATAPVPGAVPAAEEPVTPQTQPMEAPEVPVHAPQREPSPETPGGMPGSLGPAAQRLPDERPEKPGSQLSTEEIKAVVENGAQDEVPKVSAIIDEAAELVREASSPKPPKEQRRFRTGIIVAGILFLLVLVVVLPIIFPSLPDPLAARGMASGSLQPFGPSPGPAPSATPAPGVTVILTVEPTQSLPKETALIIESEKDMTNAMVTVRFSGGGGMGLVRDNTVTLTRSDGTEVSGKLNFNQRNTEVELQGTKATDRLRVVVTMKAGGTYTIVDKLIPYRYFHD